jgi:uncharacterized protein YyaL (SSP411 family)
MPRIAPLLLLLIALLPGAAQSPLADHPSPYLAMHAADPVQWQLWGEGVFAQAKREQRLIFISSGYFACHWCHVMQRESFRSTSIARRLNRDFIPVKIDRELWPELDRTLIDFVERTRGTAGWPLNVFLTPAGHPLVGTTYLPPQEFEAYLVRLQQRWQQERERLTVLAAGAAQQPQIHTNRALALDGAELADALAKALQQAWHEQADELAGGFGSEAKFPQVPLLMSLMRMARSAERDEFLLLTLEQMAAHGLRDHLGGGFFRYTIDPAWLEPHFEKMLYDNAQLASLYLQAARLFGKEGYRQVGLQTLDFLLREMRHPQGGFVSALSAVDGRDIEGGYYLWQAEELVALLGEKEASQARRYWGMTGPAVWEQGYLPLPQAGYDEVGAATLQRWRERLLQQRQERALPRDDKRLASWNALVLSALSIAESDEERYAAAGREVRDYLHQLWDGKRLWRLRDERGRRRLPAGLQDYALAARALLQWEQATGDEESRRLAATLIATAWQRFYNPAGWLPGGESSLIGRRSPVLAADALPSAAVVLLEANLMLGEQGPISRRAMKQALTAEPLTLLSAPLAYSGYLSLLQLLRDG